MADEFFGGLAEGIKSGIENSMAYQRSQQQKEAQAVTNAYKAATLKLQQKRAEIQERQLDLTIVQRLTQVMDSKNLHPEARAFLLDEIASAAGHDVKSERYKGLKKVLLSMPQEQADALTEALAGILPNAEPGAIRGVIDNLIKGGISLDKIPELMQTYQQGQARSSILGGTTAPTETGTEGGEPQAPGSTPGVSPSSAASAPPMAAPMQEEMTPQQWRQKARELGAAGDLEGARVALQAARDIEGPPKAFESTLDKNLADRDKKLMDELDHDMQLVRRAEVSLQAMDTALEGGRFTPGSFSTLRQSISQIAEFVGLNPEDPTMKMLLGTGDPATAEAFHAASNRLALDMADKLSKMTNMSLSFVADAVPNLARTPAGNKIIMEMIRAGNARTIEAHNLMEEYIVKYGTLRPPGVMSFYERLRQIQSKPLFDQQFIDRVKTESRRGAAVNITGGIERISEGGERATVKSLDGKRTFKVVETRNGVPYVDTKFGPAPFITTTEQRDAFLDNPEDRYMVWGPTGELFGRRGR